MLNAICFKTFEIMLIHINVIIFCNESLFEGFKIKIFIGHYLNIIWKGFIHIRGCWNDLSQSHIQKTDRRSRIRYFWKYFFVWPIIFHDSPCTHTHTQRHIKKCTVSAGNNKKNSAWCQTTELRFILRRIIYLFLTTQCYLKFDAHSNCQAKLKLSDLTLLYLKATSKIME